MIRRRHFHNITRHSQQFSTVPLSGLCPKLKSRYGRGIDSRNRVRNGIGKLHRLAGWYDNSMPTWFQAPIAGLKLPSLYINHYFWVLSRKLSPARGRGIGSRNRVWNWVAKLHRLVGRNDNPMPTWFLAPIAGLKLTTLYKTRLGHPPHPHLISVTRVIPACTAECGSWN